MKSVVLELDFEGTFGVLHCFPGVLTTGSHYIFDSGVVDPRDDAYNFNSSSGCQDDLSKLAEVFFFFLIFNSYLSSWLKGMNPIAQRNGCPF